MSWIKFEEVDFTKDNVDYHIDTRDFAVNTSENYPYGLPSRKGEPFTDMERLVKVLKHIKDNTGTKDWRHIIMQSEGGGWLKYIRISVTNGDIRIFTTWREKYDKEYFIDQLDNPVVRSESGMYYEIQDGEPENKTKESFNKKVAKTFKAPCQLHTPKPNKYKIKKKYGW